MSKPIDDAEQDQRDSEPWPPLDIECPRCGASVGEPCVWQTAGQEPDPAVSHFAREV